MQEVDDWQPDKREHFRHVIARVNHFLNTLIKRPEDRIVVVSHGVWIECCFHLHAPSVLQNGSRVQNCDMFVAECISKNGSFISLQNVRRIE
jgi:broad specificity phosphatase PhoE